MTMPVRPEGAAGAPVDWESLDLYRLFGLVLGPPTPDGFALLARPEMAQAFEDLWKRLECEGEFPGFEWFPSREVYESAYIALFDVGVPEPPVALFESAHDKSRPAQEIALENTYFHEVLGLKVDPSRAVPDYLLTQLEFLAALRFVEENATEAEAAASVARAKSDFLERHLLNWVPAAGAKLERTGAPGFPVLMAMLIRFLRREHEACARPALT
jgi:DMSO reductase family type II enzyme chaperone